MAKKNKKMFEVGESETIADCLDKMVKEGYTPIRRIEKPIFAKKGSKAQEEYVPVRQQIVFEGVLTKDEQ